MVSWRRNVLLVCIESHDFRHRIVTIWTPDLDTKNGRWTPIWTPESHLIEDNPFLMPLDSSSLRSKTVNRKAGVENPAIESEPVEHFLLLLPQSILPAP